MRDLTHKNNGGEEQPVDPTTQQYRSNYSGYDDEFDDSGISKPNPRDEMTIEEFRARLQTIAKDEEKHKNMYPYKRQIRVYDSVEDMLDNFGNDFNNELAEEFFSWDFEKDGIVAAMQKALNGGSEYFPVHATTAEFNEAVANSEEVSDMLGEESHARYREELDFVDYGTYGHGMSEKYIPLLLKNGKPFVVFRGVLANGNEGLSVKDILNMNAEPNNRGAKSLIHHNPVNTFGDAIYMSGDKQVALLYAEDYDSVMKFVVNPNEIKVANYDDFADELSYMDAVNQIREMLYNKAYEIGGAEKAQEFDENCSDIAMVNMLAVIMGYDAFYNYDGQLDFFNTQNGIKIVKDWE